MNLSTNFTADKKSVISTLELTGGAKHDKKWSVWCDLLGQFKRDRGCWPTERLSPLYRWSFRQFGYFKNGLLRGDREKRLAEIGYFSDDGFEAFCCRSIWMRRYAELLEFKKMYGHTNVRRSRKSVTDQDRLGNWVWIQRQRRRGTYMRGKDRMTDQQVELLDAIGFEWDSHQRKFNVMLDKYSAYQLSRDAGLSHEMDDSLRNWVQTQRNLLRAGSLSPCREVMLNHCYPYWSTKESELSWHVNYKKLIAFKELYGHTSIPNSYPEDLVLGRWVSVQRIKRKKGSLDPDKEKLLNKLGFTWQLRGVRLTRSDRIQQIADHIVKHGKFSRFAGQDVSKGLLSFVNSVRFRKRKGLLGEDFVAALDKVGFCWQA